MTRQPGQRARVAWEPRGWQSAVWQCPVREQLLEGPRAGGKTAAPLAYFAGWCGIGFGAAWSGVVFRRTAPELKDSIGKARELLSRVANPPQFNIARSVFTWPTGESLLFHHMRVVNDYWKVHGWSMPFVLWDELTSWPTLECYDMARSINRGVAEPVPCPSCRTKRDGKWVPGPGCDVCHGAGVLRLEQIMRYIGTTNPHGPGHNAVKARFIDPAPPGAIIRRRETIYLPDETGAVAPLEIESERVRIHAPYRGSVLEENDPGYQARMLADQPEHIVRAWGGGDWDIVSGGMFDDVFDRGVHALPPLVEVPKSWTIVRALDWGSSKPFSFALWARCDDSEVEFRDGSRRSFPRGSLVRLREFYGTNGRPNEGLRMTADELARALVEKEREWGFAGRVKPGPADVPTDEDDSDRDVKGKLEGYGLRFTEPDKRSGSRVAGWESIRTMLQEARKSPPERPGLWVIERENPHWLRLMPVMQRDDRNLDDVDTDSEDHIADETRYMALARGPMTATTRSAAEVFISKKTSTKRKRLF